MSSKWFAKHFACWSGREQKDHGEQRQQRSASADEMSITRNSKRFGQHNDSCAKDGVVKCCDKFCKNHCNLSMMRNELKGEQQQQRCFRRSFNASKGVKSSSWSLGGT